MLFRSAKLGQSEEAIADFKEAIRLDPYNVSAFYGMANAHRRLGNDSDWRAALEKFNELSQAGHQGVSSSYQGQGRYAEVVSDASGADLSVDDRNGPFAFAEPERVGPTPLYATLIDGDGDGDADVLSGAPLALYGRGRDAVELDPPAAPSSFALAVDLDNDERHEVVLCGATTELLHGPAPSQWTTMATLPAAQRAVAADVDHDGDLDLLLMGDRHHLMTNDGKASFNDVTDAASLGDQPPIQRAIFSDYDDDRDIDFYAISSEGLHLYSNNRDGTFSDVAASLGLTPSAPRTMAVEDVDQDGYMDLLVVSDDGSVTLWHNEGGTGFTRQSTTEAAGAMALLSADVDNDGDMDFWQLGDSGATLLAWHDGSLRAAERVLEGQKTYPALAADFDRDGRTDLWSAGSLVANRTQGGRWVRIALQGLNSNRAGIGTKVEIKTENRMQKREVRGNGNAEGELQIGRAHV